MLVYRCVCLCGILVDIDVNVYVVVGFWEWYGLIWLLVW